MDFRVWALLSAFFAGLTALLAKKGVEGVPSNLALAARVLVIFVFVIGLAFATGQTSIRELTARNWTFLALSGLATGASWLFYFRAIQAGPISQVAPIDKLSFVIAAVLGFVFLREKLTANLAIGIALIVAGVLVTLR
ncbi:MAG: EamA family transporter [Fimbriimonas sp.]